MVARLTGEANRWMVDCLGVGPGDRLLDVGCGPGLAVAYAAEVRGARAAGVDASEVMVARARRRNRAAIGDGRVEIHRAEAAHLPFPDGSFTVAGSLNSLQFWPHPEEGLAELHRVLAPGGRVAVVLMARSDDPTGPAPPAWMEEAADGMRTVGFGEVTTDSRPFGGVLHRALLAQRPEREWRPTRPHGGWGEEGRQS